VTAAACVPFASPDQPLLTAEQTFFGESRPGTFIPWVETSPLDGSSEVASAGLSETAIQVVSDTADAEGAPIPTVVVGAARNSSPVADTLTDPIVLAGVLALIAVAIGLPWMVLRRGTSVRYGTSASGM